MSDLRQKITYYTLALIDNIHYAVEHMQTHSLRKVEATKKIVDELLKAIFITEARYTTRLSKILVGSKANKKWPMCFNYLDLIRACPKDSYPLPNIDKLIDISYGFKLLYFKDAYSRHYNIPSDNLDCSKTTFITNKWSLCYKVMPFGLKNIVATYHRVMKKIFKNQIENMLKVYMGDTTVKSNKKIRRTHDSPIIYI